MIKEQIFEKVQNILNEELDVDKEDVLPDSKLVGDIGLSSMEILNLVSTVEKTFSIKISEKLLRTFVTTQDLVDCIATRLEDKA